MNAKKVLLGLALLIGLVGLVLFAGGLAIDPAIAIGTEKQLDSPPGMIWPYLDSASGLQRWWRPLTVKKTDGPDEGPGLRVSFESDGRTLENWTVKETRPPHEIAYDVEFVGMMTVQRTLTLEPVEGGGTKIVWRETGEIENPLMRWGKVLMTPDSVIANFDRALLALGEAAKTSTAAR